MLVVSKAFDQKLAWETERAVNSLVICLLAKNPDNEPSVHDDADFINQRIHRIVAERFNTGPDDPDDPPPAMISLAARRAMLKH
jgi:hypothetical protein